ncbi:MAG: phosphatidate cytidylyltransferase [Candidatus Omnitrophica bacterium]|nr:phosphatidate cytidylyltransferase [Candidatus Omnitrophota bacterium]
MKSFKKEKEGSEHNIPNGSSLTLLQRRIITSVSIITVVGSILLTAPAWTFALLITFFIVLGLNEYFLLIQRKDIGVNRKLGIALGVIVALATYFDYRIPYEWFFVFIPVICLTIFIVQFTKKDNGSILSISTILFGLVYVSWFLSFFIRLRNMPELGTELLRRQLIAFLILVTKSGDIGAYLVGMKFGRHKLIPRISPKKTIEGMLGGLLLSILVALSSHLFLPSFSLLRLLILGFVLGALAQVGDLSESLIKRDCGTKDSGNTLPGIGGILDSIDSLLFTAPAMYFYIKVFM